MATKRCTKCRRKRALKLFAPNRNAADGRQSRCRKCTTAQQRRRYREDATYRQRKNRQCQQRYHTDPVFRRQRLLTEGARSRRRYRVDPDYRRRQIRNGVENHDRRVALRRQRVVEYLSSHPCVDCGEANPVVLDFDHVRGHKLRGVAALVYEARPWSEIKREMAKCAVRCANCHAIRTSRQQGWGTKGCGSRRINRQRVAEYKRSHPCIDCGETDARVLDFDHVRGRKVAGVANLIASRGWATVIMEIKKCDIRCRNCHRMRHANARS